MNSRTEALKHPLQARRDPNVRETNGAGAHLDWVDIFKGIGILAVAAGHIQRGYIGVLFYVFHMPLFFFIGGYLQKPNDRFAKYFRKKSIHLLVPYVSYLVLLFPDVLFHMSRTLGPLTRSTVLQEIGREMIGGRNLRSIVGVLWFLPCYFVTQQLANVIVTKVKMQIAIPLMAGSLLIGYGNAFLFPKLWLPLNLNDVFGALPIFYAGYLYRREKWRLPLWVAAAGVVASSVLVYFGFKVEFDMAVAYYGVPVLSLLLAFCWIVFLIAASKLISRVAYAGAALKQLGIASMTIMCLHIAIGGMLYRAGHVELKWVQLLCAVALSYLLFRIFKLNRTTSLLFLGVEKQLPDRTIDQPIPAITHPNEHTTRGRALYS